MTIPAAGLIADIYPGNYQPGHYPDVAAYTAAGHSVLIAKVDEGAGYDPTFAHHLADEMHARQGHVGEYEYWLGSVDGGVQGRDWGAKAKGADFLPIDIESGPPSINNDRFSASYIEGSVAEAVVAAREADPGKPVLTYGFQLPRDKGCDWQKFGADGHWSPRYDDAHAGADVRTWTVAELRAYSGATAIKGLPPEAIWLVQYTNGRNGPGPRELTGIGFAGDVSALCVPLATLLGAPAEHHGPKFQGPVLRLADPVQRDPEVLVWKHRLTGLHYDGFNPTSTAFGHGIDHATRAFQARNRVPVDGAVGPRTWAAAWAHGAK